MGRRAGASGSRRWVPRPCPGFGGDAAFPLLAGASYRECVEAAFPLFLVALSRRCGHPKETFHRAFPRGEGRRPRAAGASPGEVAWDPSQIEGP